MIGWLIVACEIGFWIFIILGLVFRYILRKKTLGAIFLAGTPVIDLVLLIATVADLRSGAVATTVHGLAAVYLGVSIVYGKKMVNWADKQFAYRFAGGEKPVKTKKYGMEHAKLERQGWYLHALAWLIGGAIMAAIVLFIDGPQAFEAFVQMLQERSEPPAVDAMGTFSLIRMLSIWTVALAIDFVISFSYTLFPRKAPAFTKDDV